MTDSITPEQWLKIANEVEPMPEGGEWFIESQGCHEHKVIRITTCCLTIRYEPTLRYGEAKAQQLRLADYLAEKGVVVLKENDGSFGAYLLEGNADTLNHDIAQHDKVNDCRALAALALSEGRE